MTRPMGTVSITTRMVPATKDTGSRISSMVMVRRPGLIMLVTRVIIAMERSTEEAISCGLTDQRTPVNSSKTTFTVMASTRGLMAANMTANGRITKWKVKGSLLGKTAENMRVNTSMIKRREMECLRGLMAVNTMDNGKTESSMAKDFTIQAAETLRRVNGLTESVCAGLMRLRQLIQARFRLKLVQVWQVKRQPMQDAVKKK